GRSSASRASQRAKASSNCSARRSRTCRARAGAWPPVLTARARSPRVRVAGKIASPVSGSVAELTQTPRARASATTWRVTRWRAREAHTLQVSGAVGLADPFEPCVRQFAGGHFRADQPNAGARVQQGQALAPADGAAPDHQAEAVAQVEEEREHG